ncbi:MAG: beta-glucuronidase [Lachnospiraceae bacterium]|nr:beta-glucuronidase [Lachnospiraceae bacterium]
MLYPQLNETRMRIDLNGIWDFQTAGEDSYEESQVCKPLSQPMTMAVPASYNDQKDDVNLRSFYGWVVYQRTFVVPRQAAGERLVLRFGAVTHQAEVYLNGQKLGSHKGGFLPFEFEVTDCVQTGKNLLSVAVDNRVNFGTLPVGNEDNVAFFGSDNPGIPSIELAKSRCKTQNKPNFDFFNYAGIIRQVWLYKPPKEHLRDIGIGTDVDGENGIVKFHVEVGLADASQKMNADCDTKSAEPGRKETACLESDDAAPDCRNAEGKIIRIAILDEEGQIVSESFTVPAVKTAVPAIAAEESTSTANEDIAGITNSVAAATVCVIPDVKLWNPGAAYLYTARVTLETVAASGNSPLAEDAMNQGGAADESGVLDIYEQTFGVRTIEVKGTQFLINGKPFYCTGSGKQEERYFPGRVTDSCLNVKDLSLFRWMHANSFRTSHYPYAEEMYDLCDREGIVIIDETPAVGIGIGGRRNAYKEMRIHDHHRDVIRDMIARDKNHPSVVMWSLANEPDLEGFPQDALDYFSPLCELAHSLDPQNRPVTLVCCQNHYEKDITTRTMDVCCLNRYYGWYNLGGDLDAACDALNTELDFWDKQGKPVMFTEYGADTYPGIHNTNGEMFSEEYQAEYYLRIGEEIDKRSFFIGEQLWNFADFATIQGVMRVDGNKKGVLTRDRRPKLAAHALRMRWGKIPDFNFKA